MSLAALVAFYANPDEAREAHRKLTGHGHRRVTLVHQALDGAVVNADPFDWRLALRVALVTLTGFAGAAGAPFLLRRMQLPAGSLSAILAVAVIGALAVWFGLRRSRHGVDPALVSDHARTLLPGETLLLLQAPVASLPLPMALLREGNDNPPALFVLHPKSERRAQGRGTKAKLAPAQVQEHARRHAREQQVDPGPGQSDELLKRLRESRRRVRQVCADLGAASRLELKATPAADWILDNEYLLDGNARDVLLNLPKSFFRQMPTLAANPYQGQPCIYGLAKDLVAHSELHLDRESVLAFIAAYQSERTLSIGELWATPQMLRIALIEGIQNLAITALADLRERQLADFWANRLVAANRSEVNQLFGVLAELALAEPTPTPYFAAQLVGLLYDEAAALAPVQTWLERTFKSPLHEVNSREQHRQTREQISCGNAFTSLRQLALLDWREIFEKLSRVEEILRRDPSGIYPAMDFATRDRCRRAVEELARGCSASETEVAAGAVDLATGAERAGTKDERLHHVGAWLVGEGRPELVRLVSGRETPRHRLLAGIYRHHGAVYALGIGGGFAALLTLFAAAALPAGFAALPGGTPLGLGLLLLAVIPLSQLAIEVANYLVTRLLPPRPLPKMDFQVTGIPDAFRTLVVVPMLLVNEATLRAEVEKLEIRYLANKEANLFFSLFTDYTDSASVTREDDSHLIQSAIASLEELNERHPGGRFFLFHRERTWSESEQKFIGWERKRGKLEELNGLIDGTRAEDAERLVYLGDPDRLADVRFIITLDSDTQLPHGTARRLVETLAHPLNQPRFDPAGTIIGGYTIIQPRVSPTLTSTSVSTFSRLFADAVGIDPYTQAVSDVYQDLSGEGSYHGKGIYDVRAFSRVLSGRFPEEWVLSHDLIEGAHVRVGLASDIELYDEFPQGYQSYSSRAHRWIRGDWQIAGWIFPSVPQAPGGRRSNQLSLLNRWKILDNLRRSLLPATSLALLIVCWLCSPRAGALASLAVGMQLLFHPLAQPFTMATTRKGLKYFALSKLAHDLVRAAADAALLPHQAAVALDAIARVAYRRLVSGRDLLEWTAQATHWSASRRQPLFVASLGLGTLFSAGVGGMLWSLRPQSLPQALPWLALWFCSPLLGWLLNRRPAETAGTTPVSEDDRRFLREVARRTWRYFSTFVGPDTCWLPPDNFQRAHQNRLALRTSPTNIGLWMTSALGAHDLGYLTLDQLLDRLAGTMESIRRLELFHGHLLNWYDIGTLAPLEPRYVSGVDSGNLLGALVALEHGLAELAQARVLDDQAFAGLLDTGAILKRVAGRERLGGFDVDLLDQLLDEWEHPPLRAVDKLRLLRKTEASLRVSLVPRGAASWADEMEDQVVAWIATSERYLGWMQILAEKSAGELTPLGPEALAALGEDLARAPSLSDLAGGRVASIGILRALRGGETGALAPLSPWIDRVIASFHSAQWLAGETLGNLERLIAQVRALGAGMNLEFLYDPRQKLFAIGYNVSAGRLDTSSYDLLASEARLGSFVAVARGDVPLEHWFSLGRPYGAIRRQRVLLSWTGTMFEYLMPLIFQKSYANSLLDRAARQAVAVQISYGRELGVPWGISESAFADLDLEKTYQYRAFGVPALGLKRAVEEKLVVAPYASLLALNLAPAETVRNLKSLAGLGLLGDYGYYESMDFSRQPQRQGGRGVIVEAYMAHHQGMAFLSLVNFLQGDPFPRRFHADPRVRAFEALLQERIPTLPPLQLISDRKIEPQLFAAELVAPAVSSFSTPHTATPRSLLLSNGRYGLMVTNSGGGYSQWGGQELTRWRSDPTLDGGGIFCYIHEAEADRLWSSTYHPVGGEIAGYNVEFTLDRAVFRRTDDGIHTETEICVSPEDDAEVRRITLANHSTRPRRLNLTSYVELSLAPHNADRQHPAFSKLFIQTEALPGAQALLAHRRARGTADAPLFVAHSLTLEETGADPAREEPWQFETDRGRFIGRGRTLANPMGAAGELGNSQGYVLDPMLGVRRSITLQPGQSIRVSLVLAAGKSRDEVLLLLDKYSDPHATERALDFAWRAAQQQLQLLRIQPDEARRFQQLASHLLFPNRTLRAPVERLAENRKGQAGLWPYAISGDLPLVLVTVGEAREVSLVRQMLQAHTYWRMHGLATDLVILNEEAASYQRPLQERLEQLIQTHALSAASELAGGIFLRHAVQIPEGDLDLFKAAAGIYLVAARGTLPQQLGIPVEPPELLLPFPKKRIPRDPSAPLPFLELNYFNSLGGFTPDGREYAIYLGPGTSTPAPWVNVIANPSFGTLVSETGSGCTWYGNSQRNRLTGWSNDPVLDPPAEALYLRDEESGVFWSPTAAPIREATAYRARHGAGYSVFEHNSNGIEQELTVFVPVDDSGGQPVKLQRLRLTNATARKRRLSLTYYVELTLGESRETSQMHVVTSWDEESGALLARNHYHPEYGERVAFAALTPRPESHGGDRTAFIGRNRTLADPIAMEFTGLSRRTGAGLDPCAVLRVTLELAPGERRAITCLLGEAGSAAEARELVLGYREDSAFEDALEATKAWWDDLLGTVEVQTPELAADLLVNRWLQYQSLSSRIWGRTAFYQSGGAFGFRDQLQDAMAFLQARPALAREHILRAAGRQFPEGDVQHWWHEPAGAGIRSRISDDLLWLPYVTAQYVRSTGDAGILREEVPFLSAPVLAADQHEAFGTPEVTSERATLFEHCERALACGLTIGPHGLPLIGTGDWNDGMNLVGAEGRGESVWLAWFLCDCLKGMAELSELLGEPDLARGYLKERSDLVQRVEKCAWDGEWYLRGTFDDGSPLGSAANAEARIDSLPQSWAWLCGAADPERADRALESAWLHLVRQEEGLVLLFEPPFENADPSPGYIKGYPPGVRENGGQYTHAALWMAMALARKGEGDRAAQLLRLLNPIEHARDAQGAWRYGVEPYVIAADVYRLPGRIGQGGWSWYTGSAAWMYRAWVEEVLGLVVRGGELRVNPVIPAAWPGFSMRYRHGESLYAIRVENPEGCQGGVAWVEMDGKRLAGGVIPLERGLVQHQVVVRMGRPEPVAARQGG
ncbi:GH36-type glycosyl hydrolase domain-containing protein [Geomesophilobacter sediminis]|uniref:Glycosyl transferase n=1 Tax=Geomesophilobacter sediminis TaxID=2798584 RepID=A0A8J7SDR1_9BACT|nr:glucoamylase family protein [Geomesophilobacter sediminis]MBJ6727949.1 glycosyl transferase [Geomesophilobacter sediminis]